MSVRQQRGVGIGVLLVAICAGVGLTFAQRAEPVEPETLLPVDAVLYVGIDGSDEHAAAWQQTAAYEALYESGLMDVLGKLLTTVQNQAGGEDGPAGHLAAAARHIASHGFSLAVSPGAADGAPSPWAIVVLHDAADFEDGLAQLAIGAARDRISFQEAEQDGRSITKGLVPNSPGVEVAWWSEGEHLVIVAGMNAVRASLDVVDGGENITANPLWTQHAQAAADFEVARVAWLDFGTILDTIGPMTIPRSQHEGRPEGVTFQQAAEVLGLDGLNAVVGRAGYKGRAQWSEMRVDAPGARHGLLALSDQQPFSLADLPPLPVGVTGFSATSFDWSQAYDIVLETAHGVESLLPPAQQGQVDAALVQVHDRLGFDLQTELLEPLGNVHCVYTDTNQAPLWLGTGVLVSVDDADALRNSLNKLLAFIEQQAQGNFAVQRVHKHGHELLLLEVGRGASSLALCITDDWLAFGTVPQTVEAFLLRQAGELDVWEPTPELQAALAEMPDEFTALGVSDPRAVYRLLVGLAPYAVGPAQLALRQSQMVPPDFEFSFSIADIPPAEVVTRPLFPNLSIATIGDDGVTYTSRKSLGGLPIGGAVDGGTAITSSAVLVALLLPAVQQAREAARRTQSMNNMRQIMLAMHNYHDVFQQFPEGTWPNEKLEPDERLSWLTRVLPYLDQAPLYNIIDFDGGWEDQANELPLQTMIPLLLNPSMVYEPGDYAPTHYIGLAGLGEDGPTLPVTSRKAGVFAYDRATRIRDITDGTSNTIAIATSSDPGPWGAGGHATIRALTEKPYINGPDGIGGPHAGGIHVGLCDGSVRFVSENIDSSVLEALTTISGGEVIGDF